VFGGQWKVVHVQNPCRRVRANILAHLNNSHNGNFQPATVYREFGAFAEQEWIGHNSKVRADHYLMLTDDDYSKATQWITPSEGRKHPHGETKCRKKTDDSSFPAFFPAARIGNDQQGSEGKKMKKSRKP